MAPKNGKTNHDLLYKIIALLFVFSFIIGIVWVVIIIITPKQKILLFLFAILAFSLFLAIKKGWLKKLISKKASPNTISNNAPKPQPQLSAPALQKNNIFSSKLDDILISIDRMSTHGLDFEEFTVQLLLDNGFENVKKTQGSGDYGIDVLASKEGITYAIQCKCYSDKVGNKAVQEAFSGKNFYNCMVAVVLTNNYFTNAAIETAKANNVLLWDREKLIDFLKAYIIKERGRQAKTHLRSMAISVKQVLESHNIENTVDDIFLNTDTTLINLKIIDDKKRMEVSNYLEEIAQYIPSSCVKIEKINPPIITLSIDNPSELKVLL